MLGFQRSTDNRDAGKPGALKPALYDPPGSTAKAAASSARPSASPPAPARDGAIATHAAADDGAMQENAVPLALAAPASHAAEAPGSRLFIGVNIKLKGVEISDCDVLVIEGHVEATVHSKLMQISKPGTLKGTALIDVAEVHGEFTGELTARSRLVVHATGRVSGTIRYGKLIVAEGGELNGDIQQLEASGEQAQPSLIPAFNLRHAPDAVREAALASGDGARLS